MPPLLWATKILSVGKLTLGNSGIGLQIPLMGAGIPNARENSQKQRSRELEVSHAVRRWWARVLICPLMASAVSRQTPHRH